MSLSPRLYTDGEYRAKIQVTFTVDRSMLAAAALLELDIRHSQDPPADWVEALGALPKGAIEARLRDHLSAYGYDMGFEAPEEKASFDFPWFQLWPYAQDHVASLWPEFGGSVA